MLLHKIFIPAPRMSFDKGLCIFGAISRPDKHNKIVHDENSILSSISIVEKSELRVKTRVKKILKLILVYLHYRGESENLKNLDFYMIFLWFVNLLFCFCFQGLCLTLRLSPWPTSVQQPHQSSFHVSTLI